MECERYWGIAQGAIPGPRGARAFILRERLAAIDLHSGALRDRAFIAIENVLEIDIIAIKIIEDVH